MRCSAAADARRCRGVRAPLRHCRRLKLSSVLGTARGTIYNGGVTQTFEANLGLALGVARARQPSSRGRIRVSLKARDEPSTASAKLADRAAYSSPELRTEARGAHVNKNVRLLHAQGDAAAAHGRDEPAAPEHGVAAAVGAARSRGRSP